MPASIPSFYIVMLNWNGWRDTVESLASLRKLTYPNFKIVLVDNGSTDESVVNLRRDYPEVHIIEAGENLGFAQGCNTGITYALEHGADYIMLLNNDTMVAPDFIEPLKDALVNGSDVVAPIIYYASDPKKVWFAGSHIDWRTGLAYHTPANVEDSGQFKGIIDLEYVTGCCLTASADTWRQVGMLDPSYFAYFEDADWSVRATRLGMRLRLVADSRIWHKVSRAPMRMRVGRFLGTRNGLLFIRKQVTGNRMPVYLRFIRHWVLKPMLRELVRREWDLALARAQGIAAHIFQHYGSPYAASNPFTSIKRAETPVEVTGNASALRAIAFYLPQYHAIPENDKWWGEGFTDWVNVRKTKPAFKGHYQPHVPRDLGYYDLRDEAVREGQAKLARQYGVHGFCYYHYWFDGRQLLEQPIKAVLASGKPNLPFCLCWANENWTRRWDGQDHEVLIAQNYSDADDLSHIHALLPYFKDPRYIRVNGKPVFLVYRTEMLPDPARTAKIWREEARQAGIQDLYLVRVESVFSTPAPPETIGFDASVEFAPDMKSLGQPKFHGRRFALFRKANLVPTVFKQHWVRTYKSMVKAMLSKPEPKYRRFMSVCPGWDNSARREIGATIFTDATPQRYQEWLAQVVQRTMHRFEGDERLIFINAWNEWAEGCHLEPDEKHHHEFLQATRTALLGLHGDVKVLKRKAAHSSVALVVRQCTTKIIGFATNIALARLLIPEHFGVFAIVSGAVGIFNMFGDAGLAASLIRQKDEPTRDEENSIFSLQQILVGLPVIAAILAAPFIDRLYKLSPSDVWLIQLVAISSFLSSFRVIPSIRLERRLAFDVLARVEVAQSVIYCATAVAFAKLGVGAWSFALGSVFCQLGALWLLLRAEPWMPAWRFDWKEWKERLSFGVSFQSLSVVNFIRDCGSPLFVGIVCGAQLLGFVTLASTTAMYPILLGTMLSRLHFPLFSRARHDPETLVKVAEAVVRWNNLCVLGLSSVFIPLGREFILHAYGAKWCAPVDVFYLCAMANLFLGTTWPLLALAYALGRVDIPLRYSTVLTIATWMLLMPFVVVWGPLGYGLTQLLVQVVNLPLYREVARMLPIRLIEQIRPTIAAALLNGILTMVLVRALHVDSIYMLVAVASLSLISFVLLANAMWGNVLVRETVEMFRSAISGGGPMSLRDSERLGQESTLAAK